MTTFLFNLWVDQLSESKTKKKKENQNFKESRK